MARFPTYAPEFRVEIDGEADPAALRGWVSRISYTDGIEGADRVEVTIANEDLRWLDHPLLQVDNGFTLSLGYAPDPLERGLRRRDHRRQRLVPERRHADADGRRARLPAAADDRHQGPRLHAQHPTDRPVPAAGSGGGLRWSRRQPARPAKPIRSAPPCRSSSCLSPTRSARRRRRQGVRDADKESDFDFLSRVAKRQRLGDVHRPHRRTAGLGAAVPCSRSRTRAERQPDLGHIAARLHARLTTVGQVLGVADPDLGPASRWSSSWSSAGTTTAPRSTCRSIPGLDQLVDEDHRAARRDVLTIVAAGRDGPEEAAGRAAAAPEQPPDRQRQRGREPGHQGRPGHRPRRAWASSSAARTAITSATHTIDGGGFRTASSPQRDLVRLASPRRRASAGCSGSTASGSADRCDERRTTR